MGLFSFEESKDAHEKLESGNHADLSHELLGSAVAFGAMKAWESKQRKSGQPVEHAKAKELLAAAVGFELDSLAESKGADFVERKKIEHQAHKQAEQYYDEHYGDKDQWHPDQEPPRAFDL